MSARGLRHTSARATVGLPMRICKRSTRLSVLLPTVTQDLMPATTHAHTPRVGTELPVDEHHGFQIADAVSEMVAVAGYSAGLPFTVEHYHDPATFGARPAAAVRPAGPPPTIRTSTSMSLRLTAFVPSVSVRPRAWIRLLRRSRTLGSGHSWPWFGGGARPCWSAGWWSRRCHEFRPL